jgi:hypothetical protein
MEKHPPFKLGEASSAEIERAMLDIVLKVAHDDESLIQKGITSALKDTQDRARRTYLWNTLKRKATEKIRKNRKSTTA